MTPPDTASAARRRTWAGAALALGLALLAGPVAALEVKMFAIEDFLSDCGGGDRWSWGNMADAWYDEMDDQGHSKDGSYIDGNMTIQRFCDPDWDGDCEDDVFADDADAVIIATHGSDSGDHWQGTMRYRWNGHCTLDGGGTSEEVRLGDIDAEFVTLSSCNSADDDNLSGLHNLMFDPADTPANGRRAHQVTAFHGVMWISSGRSDDYEDFADDAHAVAMSDAWIDNLYDDDIGDDNVEQCPIAYAISSSKSGCLNRLNHERYNNIYGDPPGNGWYCYKYVVGCNPAGETTFTKP